MFLKQLIIREKQNAVTFQKVSEEKRMLKHDLNQYFGGILPQTQNADNLTGNELRMRLKNIESYLSPLLGKYDNITPVMDTGNAALDNILNYKITDAKDKAVEICCNITYTIVGIAAPDISVLVGNLLDNAIEACENVKNSEKKVYIAIYKYERYITISVKNPIEKSILNKNPNLRSTKKEKELHGIGVKSIENIVVQYKGLKNYDEEDNFIIAEVMLLENEQTVN